MMKGFTIKNLSDTNRIKITYPQNGSKLYSIDSFNCSCEMSIEEQAVNCFCLDKGITVYPMIIGQLENGEKFAVFLPYEILKIEREILRICKIKIGQYKSKVKFNQLLDSLTTSELLKLIGEDL